MNNVEKLIALNERDIKILEEDLKKYGAKNKRVAEYDLAEIRKCKMNIEKLKKGVTNENTSKQIDNKSS